MPNKRLVLALTGASGMPYAWMLLQALHTAGVATHCIVSDAARLVLAQETELRLDDLAPFCQAMYTQHDLAAAPASGSWRHQGMVVCPCSMASLAAIANGLGSNLIHRAADVTLKEGRKLVLMPRETPLSTVHLENMLKARRAGAVILPPSPGFYHQPKELDELLAQIVGRILDQVDVEHDLGPRWGE